MNVKRVLDDLRRADKRRRRLDKHPPIIHCDNCACLCMTWQNFCSYCGRERITFAWKAVPLGSRAFLGREKMRGDKQKDYDLVLGRCSKCDSLYSVKVDRFCGFCGNEIEGFAGTAAALVFHVPCHLLQ